MGASGRINPDDFWRLYASDLQRAQDTAQLILQGTRGAQAGSDNLSNDGFREKILLDARLRELSKGARQGYHKTLSNEEAISVRRKEIESQGKVFKEEDLPAIESELDGYARFSSWLFELVREAILEHNDASTTNQEPPFLTLVVSHSALLRSILMNLFSKETLQAQGAAFDSPTHLIVPNTSLTILDIIPDLDHETWQSQFPPSLPKMSNEIWKANLVELHWTGHYHSLSESATETANNEL